MQYRSLDPATEETIARYPLATDGEWDAALDRARTIYRDWSVRPLAERAALVARAGELLESRADSLAEWMALEMGKPLAEGRAEANKCAWACRYFAEHGAAFMSAERRPSDAAESEVRFEPLGPILAIMPWNFPFWQFFRFAAPTLVAGNVVLLKHAPNTPRCALEIERLMLEAGFPEGAVRNLFLTHEQAAELIADPRLRGVTLTGSTRAGRQVASSAGRHLKQMVLELGGSDPYIVFEDADFDGAIDAAVASRCLNNGQSCIAAKRFLIEAPLFDRFRDAFVDRMRSRTVGDPRDPGVALGPLARADLRDGLAAQVRRAVDAGGELLCGGEIPKRRGFFYPATVLVGIDPAHEVAQEELFGPVAMLFPFSSEHELLEIANRTEYGLGASLWTADRERARRLIPRIESGAVFVNGMVKSDPRLPFGGIKASGFGRELAREGMLEFVNRKTVWIA